MRYSSNEEMERFVAFNKELEKLAESEPLKEVTRNSPQPLQVISHHLIFEYLIESWINFKINNGKPVFSGISKIGFHNKLYIAKNIGLPIEIFQALDLINKERNEFAHQIFKRTLKSNKIQEISKLSDNIKPTEQTVNQLGTYIDGKIKYASEIKCENTLLNLALTATHDKVRNFVFTDIYHDTSHPAP
ncbi:hypothetical protein ACVWY1_004210 [Pseudomonas sp. TE6288]